MVARGLIHPDHVDEDLSFQPATDTNLDVRSINVKKTLEALHDILGVCKEYSVIDSDATSSPASPTLTVFLKLRKSTTAFDSRAEACPFNNRSLKISDILNPER